MTNQEEVHEDSQYPKAFTLYNKDVVIFSSITGQNKCLVSQYNKKGQIVFSDIPSDISDSGSGKIVTVKDDAYLFGHNQQNLPNAKAYDSINKLVGGNFRSSKISPNSKFYAQKSMVSLKSGKILIAGIQGQETSQVLTDIDVFLYDPSSDTYGNVINFGGYGKLVSCYEQKENQVYCAYVSHQYPFVAKLTLQLFEVNPTSNTLTKKEDQIIKTFYTEFNFLKAVPFNEEEAIIIFRVGNTETLPANGNSGKEFFYYHIKLSTEEKLVIAIRYEKLNEAGSWCKYRKGEEDDSIDIGVLSENRIYMACEADNGRIRGFIIYPGKTTIDEFFFNNFEAKDVRNPVFAKFDKSLGIFYTHINNNNNYNVNFHLMNYPDCRENKVRLLPRYFSLSDVDFTGKVFISNPYPASRQNEQINIRFNTYSNILIVNTYGKAEANIEPGKDYNPELLNLKFTPGAIEGIYSIEYTATMNDLLDGLIEGRTCKITFNTPKCLDQCYSCTKLGSEEKHECIGGCKNESYYKTNYDGAVNEGFGVPFNCERCNISCYNCHGPFQLTPQTTTNCIKCDYASGYYHFVDDERTCISYETKEYWEKYIFGRPLYLDKSAGTEESKWRWKYCHENCASCSGPGDDNDNQCDTCKDNFYFYCNQTKGNGIPGSCHDNCVNNGFFLKESEGMEKCCPCLKDCKECADENTCIDCFKPFYLSPNNDSCVEDCDYCYAKDNKNFRAWQCVNCKTRYLPKVKYNLNGTCYDEIPKIEYPDPDIQGKLHWVEDDKCNWLTGCKGGCFSCKFWYTEQCTKCKPDFYKEDFYSLTQPETFPCFTENECHGIEKYKYNESMKIGGVAKVLNGEGVCYNCRLREGNYRQVENDFTCVPRAKRTYIDIAHYNKLSYCYTRCASCEEWGTGCRHNCLTCRDPKLYELIQYKDDPPKGNCERYQHKCKDLPYYHDYDLNDEIYHLESCGQECDVCLEDRKCPEQFPFYVVATRECVESCGFPEIMGQACTMNQTSALERFMKNPFEFPDKYMSIGTNIKIEQIIEVSILEKYAAKLGVSVDILTQNINTYIGKGISFNLPNNEIIIGNNISLEITTNKIEMSKIEQLIKAGIKQGIFSSDSSSASPSVNMENPPILDISECEKIIKKEYKISSSEDLIILKATNFKELSQYFTNNVNFLLFSTSLGRILPLDSCMSCITNITDVLNAYNIKDPTYSKKIGAGTNDGYNVFDSTSNFYTDICTPFTSEYGTDVLLDDRTEYYPQNIYMCKSGCSFSEYNPTTNTYTCSCLTGKINRDGSQETELVTLPAPNFEKKHTNSNIKVFKCASQVFSLKGQKGNFGSYVLLACLASSIGVIVFYALKGTKQIDIIFQDFNSIKANPPKNDSGTDSKKRSVKVEEDKKDDVMSENELNNADYDTAINKDNRKFLEIYWSFLKMKQLFIFTFYTSIDRNLRVVKIGLFILFVSFYFAFTALFFNDSIMRKIYIYRGNTDAAVHVPNIILSSLCCIIMNFLVNFVSLSDRDMIRAKKESDKKKVDKIKTWIKIKTFILLGISTILIGLFWYYVSAFCAVFKNSQGRYFINVLIAFAVCNIWPFVTSLIPAALRKYGLERNSSCMYKASKIVYYI